MTISPIEGGGSGLPTFHIPLLTAPVSTGVPPLIGDDPLPLPHGAPSSLSSAPGVPVRGDAPILLAGRLDAGDVLPDTTQLALALEAATRAMLNGRADHVLTELDAVWSSELASDSPWYLRSAALQLLGRMIDAEQVMRVAIERLPRSAALLYLLGVHTAFRGQLDAARLANDHALALHPTEPLLWLQRAALTQNADMPGSAAALLEHVQAMELSFPATQWFDTLVRIGTSAPRTATPSVQCLIERLTPSSVPALADTSSQLSPSESPLAATTLDMAVRYGLSLLESPTQSARTATHAASSGDISASYVAIVARSVAQPPTRTDVATWEALILIAGVIVMVAVPPLRIPALVFSGAMTMLIASRALR